MAAAQRKDDNSESSPASGEPNTAQEAAVNILMGKGLDISPETAQQLAQELLQAAKSHEEKSSGHHEGDTSADKEDSSRQWRGDDQRWWWSG